ncbi:MAG: hypothetical protein MUC94_07735 [bacterium]|nr:hypothetical protein [bacterium]
MKKSIIVCWIAILAHGFFYSDSFSADKKLAQTGFQFLSVATEELDVAVLQSCQSFPDDDIYGSIHKSE